jgi:hypothetical protein
VVLDRLKGGREEFPDHQALRELTFEEIVAFAGQEGAELLDLERGVVEDSHSQFILLLTVHNIYVIQLREYRD